MLAPIFKEFDADGNGYLDQTELKALVKKSLQAQRQFLPEMMLKMTMAEADRQGAPEEARAMIQKMLKETLGEIQAR